MTETYSKVLFVEGKSEKFTIPELLVANGMHLGKKMVNLKLTLEIVRVLVI